MPILYGEPEMPKSDNSPIIHFILVNPVKSDLSFLPLKEKSLKYPTFYCT